MQAQRVGRLTGAFEQFGGTLAQFAALFRRICGIDAALQELAKQRVVLIADGAARVPVGEQALAVELIEQPGRIGVAGQRLRRSGADPRQVGRAHQQFARRRRHLIENLSGEIAEHRLQRLDRQGRPHRTRVLEALQDQHQAGGPTCRLLLQQGKGRRVDLVPRGGDCTRLVGGQAQLVPTDRADQTVGQLTCERRRRIGAAEHDEIDPVARFFQREPDDVVERHAVARLLKVVEHERGARGQSVEQGAKEAARESGQVGKIVGREQTKRLTARTARGGCGLREVVEERGRIGIAAVDHVPKAGELAGLQVAGDQCRLAGTRRAGDPHHRMPALCIERREQALALEHAEQFRPAQFGEGDGVRSH